MPSSCCAVLLRDSFLNVIEHKSGLVCAAYFQLLVFFGKVFFVSVILSCLLRIVDTRCQYFCYKVFEDSNSSVCAYFVISFHAFSYLLCLFL